MKYGKSISSQVSNAGRSGFWGTDFICRWGSWLTTARPSVSRESRGDPKWRLPPRVCSDGRAVIWRLRIVIPNSCGTWWSVRLGFLKLQALLGYLYTFHAWNASSSRWVWQRRSRLLNILLLHADARIVHFNRLWSLSELSSFHRSSSITLRINQSKFEAVKLLMTLGWWDWSDVLLLWW